MSEQAILPAPFDLIEIPKGNVTLLWLWDDNLKKYEPQTFEVPAFAIAKYPVTNAQYAKFIEAGGYNQKKWWTDAGWQAREDGWGLVGWKRKRIGKPWSEPRYWHNNEWNNPTQPVVGISWFEAVAFCNWLNDVLKSASLHIRDKELQGEVMLPTEQQWQRAAQGDDGRIYPWGNDWHSKRCNNSVTPCNIFVTSPVTEYEDMNKDDSYFDVVDMIGNVSEWCRTVFREVSHEYSSDTRVLKGGSWYDVYLSNFRADARNGAHSDQWSHHIGFRFIISY